MKLPKIIEKLFHRQKAFQSTEIANQNDFLRLPTREELKEDSSKIEMLDSYKSIYSKILSSKRLITSVDLELENYYEDIKMYIELLFNLISDDQIETDFSKVNYYNDGTKKIEYMSKMSKLKSYLYNIENIRIQTTLRIVALKEILEERFFLSPLKKNSIKEEINNLECSLSIIENQRYAIAIEVNRYLTEYGMLGEEEFVTSEVDQMIIEEKCQELRSTLALFCPDTLRKLEVRKNNIVNLTLMEKTLEEYIYKHKNEAQELSKELASLHQFIKEDLELRDMTPRIPELELKLKAFSIYGRNLISEEDISNFYSLKFAALTRNMMKDQSFNLVEKANHFEVECYMDIISSKISNILTGKNDFFNRCFSADASNEVKNFSDYLKSGSDSFDFWNILNNRELLGLVVAFDKPNGLEEYFANIYASKTEFPQVDFHENTYTHSRKIRVRTEEPPFWQTQIENTEKSFFEFADKLSLETIFKMERLNEEDLDNPLYRLFKSMLEKKEKETASFKLPEGLIRICIPKSDLLDKDALIIGKIKKLAEDKEFVTPSTLIEINGPLLKGVFLTDITLNEGLQTLSNDTFNNINAEELYIPISLVDVDQSVFTSSCIYEIYIEEDSKLTKDSMVNIIVNFFTATKKGKPEYHYVSDYVREKQRAYHEGRYSTFLDLDLFDHDAVYQDFDLKLENCSRIFFQENGVPIIFFDENDLTLTSTREISDRRYSYGRTVEEKESITYEEARKIYHHLQELIKTRIKTDDEKKEKKKIE